MLSVAAVSSGAASSGYYSADSYYAKDSEEAKEASQWYGQGAAAAGLSGHVDPDKFSEIMQGFTPDNRRLGVEKDGEHVHTAGTDLTFSAPKSVSVMALVGGDKRIVAVHDAAVKTALSYVERNYLQTRMRNPETGVVERVGGQKLMAAVFRHDTSRALDPQLHSHALAANMTIGEDGKWRTVQNNAIYMHVLEIGAVYRNALAAGLKEIGYDVSRKGKDGFPEIKGVEKEVSSLFSTRRKEIEEALKSSVDKNSSAAASRAALLTRNAKTQNVDRGELYKLWRDEAAAKGFDRTAMEALKAAAKERPVLDADRALEARAAVEFAVRHISERASVYERGLVVKTALDVMERGTIVDVDREIGRRLESGQLVSAVHKTMDSPLSDAKTILTERAVIGEFNTSRSSGQVIATMNKVAPALARTSLTDGQRAAVITSLTSADRVVGVQGFAGTGKTFMLAKVKAIAEKQGYQMAGFAPSHRAVHELGAAGIEAATLQSFLARNEGVAAGRISDGALRAMQKEYAGKVIVVDEASMIGTRQMRDLLTIANRLEAAKVVLVGDKKQLDAVEAGSPFRSLQRAGMATAWMADIMRQRDPEMHAAVHHIIRGEVSAFFDKVGDRVEQVSAPATAAAEKWLGLSPEDREKTMLITQKNAWRDEINGVVREGLRTEGVVRGDDFRLERLDPQRLTTAQLGVANNYAAGDVVIFERSVRSLQASKGDVFIVAERQTPLGLVHEGAHLTDDKVTLVNEKTGRQVEFEPGKSTWFANSVSLYERSSINIAEGDAVRFDRTDLDEGVVNKATGEVISIDAGSVTLRLGDEVKTLPLDHQLLRHVDYAWGSTVHGAQGATVDNAIVAIEASGLLTTQKSLYVAASRVKDDVTLFTDDQARLEATVARVTGERLDARDLIRDDVEVRGAAELDGRDRDEGPMPSFGANDATAEKPDLTLPDPALTPEQEAIWRAQMGEMKPERSDDERTEDMPRSATEMGFRSPSDEEREERPLDDNPTEDGAHDDVRETERQTPEVDRAEEPEAPHEDLGDDGIEREEMRHGTHLPGVDADRSEDGDKGLDRGDDEGVER